MLNTQGRWSAFIKLGAAKEALGRNSVGLTNDLRYWRIEVEGMMLSAGLCGFPTDAGAEADALEHLFLDHSSAVDGICRKMIEQGQRHTADALIEVWEARAEKNRVAQRAFSEAANFIRQHHR